MKFKFNGGQGAILCSKCDKIIKSGGQIPEYVWDAIADGTIYDLPDVFCEECKKSK